MPNLEQVVRPAQTLVFRPIASQKGSTPIFPDDVVLLWGDSGNNVFQLSQNVKQSVNNDRSDKEESRTFDVVRIKNTEDDSQFLDVEVLTGYQARNQIDKTRTKLLFSPPQGGGNVEILKRNQTRNSGG
jgi:hypothetical protein